MVDREVAVEDLLEVALDVPEAEMEALEGLELVCEASREGADRYVADVAQEVLDSDFFSLFGFDDGGRVDEGFGGSGSILKKQRGQRMSSVAVGEHSEKAHILDFVNGKVSICRDTSLLRLDINNDQQWVWGVAFEELVDLEIRSPEFGP